jgi:hypothetical protein
MLLKSLRAAPLFSLIALTACSTDAIGPGSELVGLYRLYTVNGEPAPFLVGESEGFNVEVIEGRIEVNADKTCAFVHTFRLMSLETSEVSDRVENEPCSWSHNNVAIHLRFTNGGTISGVRGLDSLWFDFEIAQGAMRFAYFRGPPIGLPLD